MPKQTTLFNGNFQLIESVSDDEKKVIANELERLYAFQDRQLGNEKKTMLLQELTSQNLSTEAIIHGIRQLMLVELNTIKLPMLIQKAREFSFSKETVEHGPCADCRSTGHIEMVDDEKRQFLLACRCPQGDSYRKTGHAVWNGEGIQSRHGRLLKLWSPGMDGE